MKNVAIFFGGKTCEHEISIITAQQAIGSIDRGRYEIFPVYVAPDGVWRHAPGMDRLSYFIGGGAAGAEVFLTPGSAVLYRRRKRGGIRPVAELHAALLCMHGLNGEDGTLQGLLELSGLAYTSCNVPASAVCMDKIVAKSVFIGLGLKTAEFVWFTAGEFERDAEAVLARAEEAVGYPCVVKPANLGSSIGISVCADRGALRAAVGTAAAFDRRILVERALSDFFELNCSVLGIEDDIKVSECERPAAWHEFLTFEDKYLGGGRKSRKPGGEACARGKPYKAGGGEACAGGGGGVKNCGGGGIGMHGLRREFPAKVGEGLRGRIRGAAAQIFRAINAKGVVRVDFLIDKKTETVYTNEVNTIPGSLSFYLWEREGVDFKHLIDRLIYFAECERDLKAGLRYAYKTDVIASAARGAGKAGKG